jgi:intein/homing endonuclease
MYTHKGNWKKIINIQQKNYNNYIYELKLSFNTKIIKTTSEHPFFVKDIIRKTDNTIIGYSDNPYWCEAKNLDKNKHITCLPINKLSIIPEFNITNITKSIIINKKIELEEEWFMLGYFIGDGLIELKSNKNVFNFIINKTQPDVYKKISKVVHMTFKDETDKITRYTCSHKLWYEIIKDFGHLAHNKKIPEWVQDAPKECIQWFINGYFAADGCKTTKNEKYTTTSGNLAYGLQRLYAKIGKLLSVNYQIRPNTTIIEGRIVNQRNTYSMSFIKNERRKYIKCIDENYLYFPISKIEKNLQETLVYNFEVEDDNSYTVQNIAVHNCHYAFQFYVEEVNGIKYLSGLLTQRSVDAFLGAPYNFVFYSTLIHIMCLRHNFKAKELVFSGGDVHIYKNHIDQIKQQMTRTPRPFPKIKLNERLSTIDWLEMTVDDIELIGYFHHPFIKAPMAV